jgi:hypothetical protein
LKRSELKSIVKECLLEILMEGVANGVQQPIKEAKAHHVSQPVRRQALDYITAGRNTHSESSKSNVSINQPRENSRNIELAKQMAPNDPVMASIFADTASTTLREQVAADSGRPTHTQETGVDPMSLFENSGNWAALAFAEPKANRGRA